MAGDEEKNNDEEDEEDVAFHSDDNEQDDDDDFNPSAWSPDATEYGILHLLVIRSAVMEAEKPPEMANLKVVEARDCNFPTAPPARKRDRISNNNNNKDNNAVPAPSDGEDYVSEGSEGEQTGPASWSGKPGSWWRVHNQLGEDLLVREGVSLKSFEGRRVSPGELVQQAGLARSLMSGPAKGCIRLPVRPSGWVTADATRAGGPKYLVRASVPRWRVVHCPSDNGGKGNKDGSVIVREDQTLSSKAVMDVYLGDVVEQAGPEVTLSEGIVRMPVTATIIRWSDQEYGEDADGNNGHANRSAASGKAIGWVTTDASAAGGPIFFKPVAEADRTDKQGQPRRRRPKAGAA